MKLALIKGPINRTATIWGFFTSLIDVWVVQHFMKEFRENIIDKEKKGSCRGRKLS